MSVNDDIHQWVLNQALRVDGFSVELQRELERILVEEVFPDIAEQIKDVAWQQLPDNKVRLFQLRQIIREGLPIDRMRTTFLTSLVNMSVADARSFTETLSGLLPVTIQTATPSPEQFLALVQEQPFNGQLMGEWFNKLALNVQEQIVKDFRTGIIEGQPIPEMADNLLANNLDSFFPDGGEAKAIKKAIRDTKAVARTATTLVNARARELSYRGNDDIIKGVEYVATLDDRTTVICMSLDGNIYPIGEGPRPPQHWNCRSTTVPVVKSWEEMGIPAQDLNQEQRASLDGQVTGVKNAETWLKGKGDGIQNRVLGRVRADLWRSGEVANLSDFLNPDGTLKPLNALGFSRRGVRQ
jgi:SPP1 gp7 family putative phage head morphogenesis protein